MSDNQNIYTLVQDLLSKEEQTPLVGSVKQVKIPNRNIALRRSIGIKEVMSTNPSYSSPIEGQPNISKFNM